MLIKETGPEDHNPCVYAISITAAALMVMLTAREVQPSVNEALDGLLDTNHAHAASSPNPSPDVDVEIPEVVPADPFTIVEAGKTPQQTFIKEETHPEYPPEFCRK